ncbi:MAG TPA: tRNA (guanosine(46)-N7)-methyltransferase TrmB [Stellaceae bacterium]|nr:tRNA (guanosine(46)-N7)-methyltransferase TrmB [Stellaceae bacterium]
MSNETPPGAPGRRDRVHGRRRGRKLRQGQQTLLVDGLDKFAVSLDRLEQDGLAPLFDPMPRAYWLEVGFGGGEHIAWQAARNPDIGLIGCEVFQNGLVSALGHIRAGDIRNIRIVPDDARLVLEMLPDASLERAFVLFPDPWPKARHHKRRFVGMETMDQFARIMKDGAELRLGTDDVAYLRVMLATACDHPDFEWLAKGPKDWRERPEDWPQTRYEAKGIEQGRPPTFLRLRRKPRRNPIRSDQADLNGGGL